MVTIVWEYQVKADRVEEFRKIYSPNGEWSELFKRAKGFLGIRLIQSQNHPHRFVTIDEWESLRTYKAFLAQWKEEYDTLDSHCEGLTEHESCLGAFGVGFNDEEHL